MSANNAPLLDLGPEPRPSSSAGLSINLSSNNPFRNRTASPLNSPPLASPSSPFDDPPPRPTSRNPFLDQSDKSQPPAPAMTGRSNEAKSLTAEDIFQSLTLDDNTTAGLKAPAPPTQRRPVPAPRRGDKPPPPGSLAGHRPSRSQEEALRARRMQAGAPRPGGPSTSPQRRTQRRPRRNSESSTMEFDPSGLTEEEKRMIAKRRERERARREALKKEASREDKETRDSKDGKETKDLREARDGKSKSRSTRPSRRMDIIDQLDATSIYGTGHFHHDGPFDALNPHRNRQSSRRLAPMQAFPKDSLNNALGGAGPLKKQADHAQFMGNADPEAFRDYAAGGKNKNGYNYPAQGVTPIFDPVARGDIVHGDESYGLGTSTFLEGTPAARTAIQRDQEERAQDVQDGGLQRKKSLAQRIRHINRGPRGENSRNTAQSPEAMPTGGSLRSEQSPFFAEYGKGEESISVRHRDGTLSPSSPPPAYGGLLERRSTADGIMSAEESSSKPMGIIGRMKSLKGGPRKPRAPPNSDAQPGSAA